MEHITTAWRHPRRILAGLDEHVLNTASAIDATAGATGTKNRRGLLFGSELVAANYAADVGWRRFFW